MLCVEEANKQEATIKEKERKLKEQEEQRKQQHYQHVVELVDELICIGHQKERGFIPTFEEDDEMDQIFNSFLH